MLEQQEAMTMQKESWEIRLATPTFLGDAHQSGVWRTPPFKALLREWWRIAAALEHGYDHRSLREKEGRLFGNAWLDSGATQSLVRLALKHWHAGNQTHWEQDNGVRHDEVGRNVGAQLYLGYGPLSYDRQQRATTLKANAALQAGETNTLSLAWPEAETAIPNILQLIDWFGTIGGRSRNGWGSLALGLEPLGQDHPHLVNVLRDLRQCLQLDWPHAIGKDGNGSLIWESRNSFANNWKAAMTFLARTKIGFRTNLRFDGGQPHHQAQDRHLLAYPVTNHAIGGMGGNTRLANQLRFKLFRDAQGQLRARIFHTPHASPLPMPNLDQLAVWQNIHAWLDDPQHGLTRLGARP